MKYKSIVVTRHGGPEVLQVVENDLRLPAAGQARIKVLAAAVCRPDVTVRTGQALYTGTPLEQKSSYFVSDRRPYLEDWATLFKLLQDGKIKPVIAARFPILEAAKANALLESGQVVGNVALLAPELLAK